MTLGMVEIDGGGNGSEDYTGCDFLASTETSLGTMELLLETNMSDGNYQDRAGMSKPTRDLISMQSCLTAQLSTPLTMDKVFLMVVELYFPIILCSNFAGCGFRDSPPQI